MFAWCSWIRSGFIPTSDWRATTKPGKRYITFFRTPRVPFELPPMSNTVTRAYQLANGQAVPFKSDGGRTALQVATPMIDAMATVVVVEFEGGRSSG